MRKAAYIAVAVIMILAGGWFYTNHLLRSNLIKLINKAPDRTYNFEFGSLSLNIFSGDVMLKDVQIVPLTDTVGTLVTAQVTSAELNNVNITSLLAGRNLVIGRLTFIEPQFGLDIRKKPDVSDEKRQGAMQKLFGDILSRGKISEFSILNGSMRATKTEFGDQEYLLIENYNLFANDIITDSVQWNHQVPFKMGSFRTSMDSVVFRIDTSTVASTGLISYSSSSDEFLICNAAILNDRDLKSMSRAKKKQADIIEVSFDTLKISGIKAGNDFYGDLNVMSSKLEIIGLEFTDFRNKNLPRPADSEKPMFSKMVDAIPVGLEIDTILIRDAFIQYTELEKGRGRPGSLNLNNLNVRITDLSTIEAKRKTEFRIDLSCALNGSGQVMSGITVPYGDDRFIMNLIIRDLDARSLTATVEPIMGIDVASGIIRNMNFTMNANSRMSNNYLVMQYEDLKITLNDPEMHKTHQGFLSHIANSAIRTNNLPDQKNYAVASYVTSRDMYRGPFNLIWNSLREGMMQIVPSGSAKMLMELESGRKERNRNNKK